jgi:hypothetical protein
MESAERRDYIRRNEDVVSHANLASAVEDIKEEIETHVHPEVVRIIDLLEGPCEQHLDGTESRNTDAGMVKQLADVRSMLQNGVRVTQTLAGKDKAQIIAALIAAVAAIVVGIGPH